MSKNLSEKEKKLLKIPPQKTKFINQLNLED